MLRIAAAVIAERIWRCQNAVPVLIKTGSVKIIRSRLRDDVQIPCTRAADFSRRPVQHELKFANRELWEEKSGFVGAAASGPALKGIVEVYSINRDIRIDGPLSVNDDAEAIRLLCDVRR